MINAIKYSNYTHDKGFANRAKTFNHLPMARSVNGYTSALKELHHWSQAIKNTMEREFLSGLIGDQINTILAATGFNLMKKLRKIREELFVFIFNLNIWIENQIRFKRKGLLI